MHLQLLMHTSSHYQGLNRTYYYEMMDTNWMTDFWTAATNKKLTDVEILMGTVKVMEAHRFILSARSPVLKETIKKNETGNHVFTFEEEFDVDTVKHFLNFLHTGSDLLQRVHQLQATF
jgi:hypothetical protein